MRYEPTLIITRLVIERNNVSVYDEKFHAGVNVIRGENSSGKSTILNFIFYGLGGDLADWSSVARLCTRVLVEVHINGVAASLSRDISEKLGQPMDIFGGAFEASQRAQRSEWSRFPYARFNNRESFSQALFRFLKIPEVASDLSGNITMNQVLRLLYADQLSPIEDIFRFQRFDDARLRDTVGRLLCGAYDSALYDNEQKIRALLKEHEFVSGELRSLFSVLGKAGQSLTVEWLESQRSVLEQQRQDLQQMIEAAEQKIFTGTDQDELTLKAQQEAYAEVQRLQIELGSAQQDHDALLLSIADSNSFIHSLESKLEALQDVSSVAENIGNVHFQTCPACYAAVDDMPPHACHLCKSPFDSEQTRARISGLISDTALQLKQSSFLQTRREARLEKASDAVRTLDLAWQRASRRLATMQRLPSSEAREELRVLHRQAGYLDRQSEDLEQKSQIVQLIREKSERKENLNKEVTKLRTANEALRASQENRLSKAYTLIADNLRALLQSDLRRQDIFEDPRNINFTLGDNRISVDGERYFSASSRAILKSSFYVSFLAAAMSAPFFRHPRFCMIDTLENMGVEAIRSHNFQLQIARISAASRVEHQIIYATAMIAPDLDNENMTVGKYSTRDDPTISIRMS